MAAIDRSRKTQGYSSALPRSLEEMTMKDDFPHETAPVCTVTILFSDMESFSRMTEQLGDREALEVIRAHNAIVRRELAAHGGREVELQGDAFLATFSNPGCALRCAIAMQKAFAAYSEAHPQPIRVRIGLHTGEVIRDADRFFGRNVIIAARIASAARGGEILMSSFLKERGEGVRFESDRELELKGLAGRHRVCSVTWNEARHEQAIPSPMPPLLYGEQPWRVIDDHARPLHLPAC
jgi:class 3 adenylate cyclase